MLQFWAWPLQLQAGKRVPAKAQKPHKHCRIWLYHFLAHYLIEDILSACGCRQMTFGGFLAAATCDDGSNHSLLEACRRPDIHIRMQAVVGSIESATLKELDGPGLELLLCTAQSSAEWTLKGSLASSLWCKSIFAAWKGLPGD